MAYRSAVIRGKKLVSSTLADVVSIQFPHDENYEHIKGSVTWHNVDNDDGPSGDGQFDNVDSDGVAGGDDELVKVRLKLRPGTHTSHEGAHVTFQEDAGPGHLAYWNESQKVTAFDIQAPLSVSDEESGFVEDGGWLVREFWVEGVNPHYWNDPNHAEETLLSAWYSPPAGYVGQVLNDGDQVRIVVLGIDQIMVEGQQNGFQEQPSGLHNLDVNILDQDLETGSLRVMPGARRNDPQNPRDRVTIRVTTTTYPPIPVPIYWKSFDVDDPSADTEYVDPNDQGTGGVYQFSTHTYTEDEDNRGSGQLKSGHLTNPLTGESQGPDGILSVQKLTSPGHQPLVNLQVSLFPGDNYRVAVSGDRDQLSNAANRDDVGGQTLYDQSMAALSPPPSLPYVTEVITVWRLLHIKFDLMAAPTGPENIWAGVFNGFSVFGYPSTDVSSSACDVLEGFVLDIDSIATKTLHTAHSLPSPLKDGSNSLSSLPLNTYLGRFEKGTIDIGVGPSSKSFGVIANGDDTVLLKHPYPDFLPSLTPHWIRAEGGPSDPEQYIEGDVFNIFRTGTPGLYALAMSASDITAIHPNFQVTAFFGGTVYWGSNGEGGATIVDVIGYPGVGTVVCFLVWELKLPFTLRDDDRAWLLPDAQSGAYGIKFQDPILIEHLASGEVGIGRGLSELYIRPVVYYDGTSPFESWTELPFTEYASGEQLSNQYSDPQLAAEPLGQLLWALHVGSAFQPIDPYIPLCKLCTDNDPDGSSGFSGYTHGEYFGVGARQLKRGGIGAWLYREAIEEEKPNQAALLMHEIGHSLGVGHNDDVSQLATDFMKTHNGDKMYADGLSEHLIRSRTHSPGYPQ